MSNTTIPSIPVLIKDLGLLFPNELSKQKYKYGIYLCSCGKEFTTMMKSVNSKMTKSCGCYNRQKAIDTHTKHGLYTHPIHVTWTSMVQRCTNPNADKYEYYGGQGISVCERWLDASNFIEDMLPTWKESLSIDRIESTGNYEPGNCRWTTKAVQARNIKVIRSNNTSGYKGVTWHKQKEKWRATICVNKKHIHIGHFKTAIDAAKAYDTYILTNNLEHSINKKDN